MLPLVIVLVVAVAPAARTQEHPGFVVLHFARNCGQEVKSTGRAQTHFRGSLAGHVALRFKSSTSDRQIDSLIAATGVEVFSSVQRGCRRYVFSAAQREPNPTAIANALQASGLVDYATPDLGAGRSEGIPSDSFFVDDVGLRASLTRNSGAADVAPANYRMGQVLSGYTGPLMRVDAATISAHTASATSSMSALDFVKSQGITTLHLQIPDRGPAARVRVMLYSLDGTPVRQLVSETLEAGNYLVGWDGNDDRGRRVQPGVYVAVMTAGSFRETHRLVVR